MPVPYKAADGTVKGSFNRIRKIAGRKLAVFPVIVETLATEPFSFAGIVRAVALGQIFLDIGTVFAHGSVIRHKDRASIGIDGWLVRQTGKKWKI